MSSLNVFRAGLSACLLVVALCNCAVPVPIGSEIEGVVPAHEIQVVSLVREGMEFFNESRFPDAESRIRQALYLAPGMPNLRLNLAIVLDREGIYDEAEGIYRDLLKLRGERVEYVGGLARVYASSGRYKEALAAYEQLFELVMRRADSADRNSLAANTAASLASLSFRIGHMEDARCYAEIAHSLLDTPESFTRFIRTLLAMGEERAAMEQIDSYVSAKGLETNLTMLYLRTLAFYALGDDQSAQELSSRVMGTPGVDPQIEFELRAINLAMRIDASSKVELTDADTATLAALKQVLDVNPASTLYWSLRLLEAASEMEKKFSEQ